MTIEKRRCYCNKLWTDHNAGDEGCEFNADFTGRDADAWAEASANHTLATDHESWSHPRIGWTCADPLCDAYNAELAAKIDANAPDVRKPNVQVRS